MNDLWQPATAHWMVCVAVAVADRHVTGVRAFDLGGTAPGPAGDIRCRRFVVSNVPLGGRSPVVRRVAS